MRSPARSIAAVACAVLLTLAAVGCGGGDKKDGTSKTDPAKAAETTYQVAAGKVCGEWVAKIRTIPGKVTEASPTAKQDEVFVKVGQGFLDEVKELRAITPPSSLAAGVDAWLKSVTAGANEIKKQGSKLLEDGAELPFVDSDAQAAALGIKGCVTGTS